ncbi:mycofactocin biosynthesis peptidyl-dipeptidase MftE [Aquipuribacter sp. MA13-6]|uniref:mycofactocin biosynthesis peptidyl-dipeptidase MftE n=1 Tax=unclassified Aquipuribacter TaxID=2635084 RepID=UPI003EEFFD57
MSVPTLARLTWTELEGRRPLLVVPVGSTEQHGPHLPLGTDSVVAEALARALVQDLHADHPDLDPVLAPPLAYGASGEHDGFPGTVSVGLEVLRLAVVELGRSARSWSGRLLLVNGHGGNARALAGAVDLLRQEGSDAAWWPCTVPRSAVPAPDAHAGRTETSLLLHLAPADVRTGRARPGVVAPVEQLLGRLRADGVRGVSANGVLGDPTGADPAEGAAALADMLVRARRATTAWQVGADGRLLAVASPRSA